jgi:hypothetical protein
MHGVSGSQKHRLFRLYTTKNEYWKNHFCDMVTNRFHAIDESIFPTNTYITDETGSPEGIHSNAA